MHHLFEKYKGKVCIQDSLSPHRLIDSHFKDITYLLREESTALKRRNGERIKIYHRKFNFWIALHFKSGKWQTVSAFFGTLLRRECPRVSWVVNFFSSLKNNVYKSGGYKIKVKLFPVLQRALNTELERCQPLGYVSDCLGMCRLLNISQSLRVLFSKNFPYEWLYEISCLVASSIWINNASTNTRYTWRLICDRTSRRLVFSAERWPSRLCS